ncbi:MAG: 3-deoxy-7-phosphoheptulonate synthase [Roseibacillus sp.]|jgi:3-deoxy-7-phosphoheptulonate synthase|nr:3-deoxy-7-phosphoheptulonate synthase [Roseibacillus sp.]MCP4731530.1 3-deoxy-7-phosphoheptulonate synthase [Roseibacillus sp.]MDP6209026.1 3-deoxy-7-phosphoheptulonate synthase [Roseibacillus sp.]MDP7308917.1 3-deoxy-7-phosphoheptulonate synthase [Roseibacillus sp.]MDP7494850.1 3-deoxy-7-phosphoheptulonate synthase [Roseibacillus sp.]|tara:strand:- start:6964 stop:8013 length:1050 start_codon:yes stop_codon:yes gene_type:complete
MNTTPQVADLHVVRNVPLPAPAFVLSEIKRDTGEAAFVAQSRETIRAILSGHDERFLVIAGPCSIHDTRAGLEYAERFSALASELQDRIYLVMRVYFEKPRTTVGWKGLIMDPDLDGTDNIPRGLMVAREFLRQIIDLNIPTATELLDPITPQYIADLISWSAIGARTSESQTHRQMASGLSMPIGFKNTISGDLKAAINAIGAATKPQTFLGVSEQGVASAISTSGNPDCHVILRGGEGGPNYDETSVRDALTQIGEAGFPASVMIDASHANCGKNDEKMPAVFEEIIRQRAAGNNGIVGAMLESNLVAGNQKFPQPLPDLTYGQSITDKCIDWETTERLLRAAASTI